MFYYDGLQNCRAVSCKKNLFCDVYEILKNKILMSRAATVSKLTNFLKYLGPPEKGDR